MKIYIREMLMLFLIIGSQNYVQAQKGYEDTRTYLKDRIIHSPAEDYLVPFKGNTKIRAGKVGEKKQQIWEIWKEVNHDLEKLPVVSETLLAQNQVHQWELINEDPLPFYFIKKGKANGKQLPLFLNLHGSGQKDREFRASLALSKRYDDSPSYYFIPQIPNEKRYRWWFKPVQNAWEKLFRLAMIDENIDANKLYVMGISEGGYGSQRLGAYYADYLAGAGPMAGGEPLKNAPPLNYRHLAFSFHTGEHDRGFGRNDLTQLAAKVFDSLAKANPPYFNHNIVIQQGKGHAVDYTLTTPWLVKYSRNPNPKHITWVYFPMNERYRKGFYNIGIEESLGLTEGDEFDRAVFDISFDKPGNTIKIKGHLSDGDMTKKAQFAKGKIAVYLNKDYLDLSKKVKVIYNDKTVFNEKVKLMEGNLVESCGLFGDPYRLFPAKISVNL